jgi:uncharacterized membrane protein
MPLIQSEIGKIRLVLIVCTLVALISFTACVVAGILSTQLLAPCLVAFLVVEGFWCYRQLRKVAAKQRAIDALAGIDSPASGATEPASEPTPNGAVCYLYGIGFPILYFSSTLRKRNDFLRFHCFQCLILFSILAPLIFLQDHAPRAEHLISLLQSIWFLGWIVSMIMAARRKMFHLPVIGALAEWLARR